MLGFRRTGAGRLNPGRHCKKNWLTAREQAENEDDIKSQRKELDSRNAAKKERFGVGGATARAAAPSPSSTLAVMTMHTLDLQFARLKRVLLMAEYPMNSRSYRTVILLIGHFENSSWGGTRICISLTRPPSSSFRNDLLPMLKS